jgi:hypothetical protein
MNDEQTDRAVERPLTPVRALTFGIFALNTMAEPSASSQDDVDELDANTDAAVTALAELRDTCKIAAALTPADVVYVRRLLTAAGDKFLPVGVDFERIRGVLADPTSYLPRRFVGGLHDGPADPMFWRDLRAARARCSDGWTDTTDALGALMDAVDAMLKTDGVWIGCDACLDGPAEGVVVGMGDGSRIQRCETCERYEDDLFATIVAAVVVNGAVHDDVAIRYEIDPTKVEWFTDGEHPNAVTYDRTDMDPLPVKEGTSPWIEVDGKPVDWNKITGYARLVGAVSE